jgi:hypothetical protein
MGGRNNIFMGGSTAFIMYGNISFGFWKDLFYQWKHYLPYSLLA